MDGSLNAAEFAGMDLILWRDKDEEGIELQQKAITFLTPHARSIRIIEPPTELPEAGDIIDAIALLRWDAARIRGLMASAIEIYRTDEISAVVAARRSDNQAQDAAYTEEFRVDKTGVYSVDPTGVKGDQWICPALEVIGRTRDFAGQGCGKLVRFKNWEGEQKICMLPLHKLIAEGRESIQSLLDLGFKPHYSR